MRGWWTVGAVALAAGAVALMGATGALGASDSTATPVDFPTPIGFPDAGAARQAFEQAQNLALRAQAFRDSTQGQNERSASRQAYRDQSADEALATARRKFSEAVDAPALKLPALGSGEALDRYLGPKSAIVTGPGGHQAVLESSLPLKGQAPDGSTAPLDMSLLDQGDAFAPKSTLGAVRIPKQAGGEVRFPDQGFGIRLPSSGADAKLSSDHAFFANAFHDGDVVVNATPLGAEISLVLRSPASPTSPALSFNLPSDAQLRLATPSDADQVPVGSAEVVRAGRRVALIAPPAAFDAQGQPIGVSYQVDGDRLVLVVDDGGDVAWPVMVDPTTFVYDNNGQSAGAGTQGYNWPGWINATSAGRLTGCPTTTQAFKECMSNGILTVWAFTQAQAGTAPVYAAWDYGAWRKLARSGTYIWRLDLANMSHYTSSDNKSLIFGEICTTNCAGSQSGYWWTPWDTTLGYPTQGGSTAARLNGAAIRSQTEYYCVDPNPVPKQSCDFSASATNPNVQTNNTAEWGLVMTGGWPATQPYAALGGAATLSSDNVPPDIVSATHATTPQTGWVTS
jgi:hypothetical protein